MPHQEEVYDLALLALGQGESGCQGLEDDLRLMGLGSGSLARAAGGTAADAGAGRSQQQQLPPSAAAALQRMQERALQAFAEAGQDSNGMLVALRKLATAKWGGQLLKVCGCMWTGGWDFGGGTRREVEAGRVSDQPPCTKLQLPLILSLQRTPPCHRSPTSSLHPFGFQDTVLRWPSLPAEQQQAVFDALLVAAAQGAWQQMEARLRLALELS